MITDPLLRRIGSLQIARSLMIAGSWVFAVAGLVPVILFHDMVIGVSGFIVTVFFLGFATRRCGPRRWTSRPTTPALRAR